MKKNFLNLIIFSAVFLSFFPRVVLARLRNPLVCQTLLECIERITNFIFYIAIILVPLMIIIGAFYLITSAGDPNRTKAGKNIIIYTLIGLFFILLAKGVIALIKSLLKVKPPS